MVVCGEDVRKLILYLQRYELQDEYTPRGKSNVEHGLLASLRPRSDQETAWSMTCIQKIVLLTHVLGKRYADLASVDACSYLV
jgi:hypothetical protein